MSIEFAKEKLNELLDNFNTKYVMEIVRTSGESRYNLVDELLILNFKTASELKSKYKLPDEIKEIKFYKVELDKETLKINLSSVNLSKITHSSVFGKMYQDTLNNLRTKSNPD